MDDEKTKKEKQLKKFCDEEKEKVFRLLTSLHANKEGHRKAV